MQKGVAENQGGHGFDHRYGTGQDTGVVAALGFKSHRSAIEGGG